MHVWTKPICWNHRGNHEQNSMFETKRKASGLFCFFSSPSCFLTTCQDLAQAWILTAIQKAPNHRLAAKASDQPPTLSPCLCVSVSHSSERANGTFYCVILLPGRKERGKGEGKGPVLDTKPTLCFVVFLLFLKVRQHYRHHSLLFSRLCFLSPWFSFCSQSVLLLFPHFVSKNRFCP